MIVKCRDGHYYVNPRWHNDMTVIHATEGVEIWHKSKRPVKYRALFQAANKLGLAIGVKSKDGELGPVDGDMTKAIFGTGKFLDAFHSVVWITGIPAPPTSHEGCLYERPADGDDEIVDDFGIEAIKARRAKWLGELTGKA